ncbi:MAG TPA: autotransporter assembly complex family protein [Luteimonas sp.]|jgi:translocation and assembly module TamA|nr:autotransporter assembly complex family protein [Luteimonas sp.]
MPALPRLAATALVLFLAAGGARAATVARVDIRGLDAPMAQNVRISLSLVDAIGKDVSGRRLGYLVREAEAETRSALEPFGYYSPTIDVQRTPSGQAVAVTITVTPGTPVRVRRSHVAILGEGAQDRALRQVIATFAPATGAVFDQGVYEASKARVAGRLSERGYFDADLASHTVEVTRAANAADIDLSWNSGVRYALGAATFTQSPQPIIRDKLLHKLVRWTPGQPYQQGDLDRLRQSLATLDYFSRIEVEPLPAQAVDHRVPVQVTLTPAKRSIYTAGVSYGTDSGPGVRLGVERRYLNARGHKALAELDFAQRRKTLTLQYRIPAFAWVDGWYTASLQAADEQTDYIDTRRIEFVASRSGQLNRFLTATAALHALRERWAYPDPSQATLAPAYQYATFTFPSLRAEYVDVDDRLYPRRGIGASVELRGGLKGAGSDADFAQLHAQGSWFKGLGRDNRLIVRGEFGHTFTDSVLDLPPSLRFYAGGDRSIRGYNYREVGPRLRNFGLGANNVITASAEFEHYFNAQWGGAVFVDSGSAFNGRVPDWHTGVGVGLRWRSPVGPVRVDVAHGLDHPDSAFTLYLSFGADL